MRHMAMACAVVGMVVGGGVGQAGATKMARPNTMWVIESADYTGQVIDQIAKLQAVLTIEVFRDGWVEVPLALSGATITGIKISQGGGGAHLVPRGDAYALVTDRKGTYKVKVDCSIRLTQDSQYEGVAFGIPQATFSTVTLTVPRKDVELRQTDQLYVERKPAGSKGGVMLTARVGAASAVDVRWRTKPAAPEQIEPVLYGDVNTLVTLEERLARLMSVIDYRIAQGDVKMLTLRLPADWNVLNVRGAGIDDWKMTEAPDANTLVVTLGFTLKDSTYRLVLEGEQAIDEARTDYLLPELTLLGVKQERGHLAVARLGSVEIAPQTVEGGSRVDVKELPELLHTGSHAALLAFRYHQHPYRISLALTRHEDHPVLAAIAERAELVSVLTQQGGLMTRAAYLIIANKQQFVQVRLPAHATLWSCLVNGRAVKPVKGDEGALLVPLEAGGDSAQSVPVEIVYFEQRPALRRIGTVNLQGPTLNIPTTLSNWMVYTPQQVMVLRSDGNLERGRLAGEFLGGAFVQTAEASSAPMAASAKVNLDVRDASFDEEDALGRGHRMMTETEEQEKNEKQSRLLKSFFQKPEDRPNEVVNQIQARLQDTGILPLHIRLPKAGTVHQFNRLMATEEALQVTLTFVRLW